MPTDKATDDMRNRLEEKAAAKVSLANEALRGGAVERADLLLWQAADFLTRARLLPAMPG